MIDFANDSASSFALTSFPFWGIVIKSTIAVALTALACALLHRHSAAVRHRVWVFGLAASLVVPMTSSLLPQFTLHVLPSTVDAFRSATPRDLRSSSSTSTAQSSWSGSTGGFTANSVIPRPERDAPSSTAITADAPKTERSAEVPPTFSATPGIEQMLVLCWLVGTMTGSTLFLISLSRQSIRLSRLKRIDVDDWVSSVSTAARTLGLQRPIVTLESDEVCVPAVVGVLDPRLLVPCDWRTWSLAQRHCILLHELAHVKRCDVSTQLLGRLALLAYWFNPLVWHAVRRLRAERELASDDCVLLAGQTASDYAEQLLLTLRYYRPVRAAVGVEMAAVRPR